MAAIRRWDLTRGAGRGLATRRRAAIIELCDGVSGELAAGRPPDVALSAAVAVLEPEVAADLLGPLVRDRVVTGALESGEPLWTLLSRAAGRPGTEGLRLLAACWQIGSERGAAFGLVVDDVADALRDEQATAEDVAAQLAGPRATARMLALLPLLGVAMAAMLGAHPLRFLFTTPAGLACLLLGGALDLLGLRWTARIATTAARPP